jgi:LysM repeat protein
MKGIVYNYSVMSRKIIPSLLIVIMLATVLALPGQAVKADSTVSGAEMIGLINSWRTGTYGHSALIESASLDSCAQWTAQEMASINATNHLKYLGYTDASVRCAGFGFPSGSHVTENYAMGANMTIDTLAGYWSDSAHQLPASMEQYTYVGVGTALAANGMTYYVLEAGSGSGGSGSGGTVSSTTSNVTAPTTDYSQFITPVVTSTPNYDGFIYHTVQQGQTLFDIALAYGVTVKYIQEQNGLSDTTIYVGNTYKIKQVPTATITPTFTSTPVYPTRTPTLKAPTNTPGPVLTPTATPVPSMLDKISNVDRPMVGLVLVILSALGLLAVVFFTFIKPGKAPAPAAVPEPVVEEVKPKRRKKAPVQEVEPEATPAAAKKPKSSVKPAGQPAVEVVPAKRSTKTKATAPVSGEAPVEVKPAKKKSTTPEVQKPAESVPETKKPKAAKKVETPETSVEPPAPKKRTTKPKTE